MAMHAPATGLIAASACHRTALAQREALSSLPSGAPGAAGSGQCVVSSFKPRTVKYSFSYLTTNDT